MLQGKTAVITGGSRGIGAAICSLYAKNGANIALIYRQDQAKAAQLQAQLAVYPVKISIYPCNVADAGQVGLTFQKIAADFGSIDILVNNAGITKDKLLLAMKEADFDEVIAVNLKGAFNTIKQVYPIFMKQKSGKIINISSVAGLSGNAGQANYAAAKAGLIGLTKTVAKELASRGICCNAIAPGFITTEMTKNLSADNALAEQIPLKRFGTAEEVAELALFLASAQANYITGEVIRVDGGLAM
ncbi:MAG: 3-oxoacyl-[acyl-carrier-protein] reductase [Negativicutes bacterium]|nr:3-oxoacyl-[acyl-carrier-protein] reductase [Negativicutes bacterium]